MAVGLETNVSSTELQRMTEVINTKGWKNRESASQSDVPPATHKADSSKCKVGVFTQIQSFLTTSALIVIMKRLE